MRVHAATAAFRAVVLAGLCVPLGGCGPPARERPPNVLLISIDTLRPDHLGCYGYEPPTSPSVDRFRKDAVLFSQAIAQSSSTLPSHASLLTSLVPQHHGAWHSQDRPLAERALTLAEVLKQAGYATFAVVGGGQLEPVYGLDQGFDVYEVRGTFAEVEGRGRKLLGKRPPEPFFLFLHAYETHHPYTPEGWRLAMFEAEGYDGDLPDEITIELLREVNRGHRTLGAGDLAHITHAYDAEINSMDEAFGELIDWLSENSLYDSSLIVFTSDHGEEFGEHGWVGWHSHTLYEELLRVPLLLKLPYGAHAGSAVTTAVGSMDVAPTILEMAGIAQPPVFEGRDLLPTITSPQHRLPPAISWRECRESEMLACSSLRSADWKWDGGRLFDLRADPGESEDVAPRYADRTRAMEAMLRQTLDSRPMLDSEAVEVDREARERLRALGYLR